MTTIYHPTPLTKYNKNWRRWTVTLNHVPHTAFNRRRRALRNKTPNRKDPVIVIRTSHETLQNIVDRGFRLKEKWTTYIHQSSETLDIWVLCEEDAVLVRLMQP